MSFCPAHLVGTVRAGLYHRAATPIPTGAFVAPPRGISESRSGLYNIVLEEWACADDPSEEDWEEEEAVLSRCRHRKESRPRWPRGGKRRNLRSPEKARGDQAELGARQTLADPGRPAERYRPQLHPQSEDRLTHRPPCPVFVPARTGTSLEFSWNPARAEVHDEGAGRGNCESACGPSGRRRRQVG